MHHQTDFKATARDITNERHFFLYVRRGYLKPIIILTRPNMTIPTSECISYEAEGTLHHLCLDMTYTRVNLSNRIYDAVSSERVLCGVGDAIDHLFSFWLINNNERAELPHTLSPLDSRPFSAMKVLGEWPTLDRGAQTFGTLDPSLPA